MHNIFKTNSPKNKTWINNYDERFLSIKFSSATDPLNPHSLWSYAAGNDKQMIEEFTGSTKNRLKNALMNYERSVLITNSKGWKEKHWKVFTDVVIKVSTKIWDKYAQIGGTTIQYFSETLEKLHEKDFGDQLWTDRQPTYVITPEPKLKPDEIVVQIGLGVFIPREEDEQIGKIQVKLSNENTWNDLPDWSIWEEGKLIKRPAGLYKNQQFLVLGPDMLSSAVNVLYPSNNKPVWFDHGKGRIFLNLSSEDRLRAYGDNTYISHGIVKLLTDNNETICAFDDKSKESETNTTKSPQLLIKVTPFQKQKVQTEAEINSDTDDIDSETEEDLSFRTYIPPDDDEPETDSSNFEGSTYIPEDDQDFHRLVLTGFALPRIDTPQGKYPNLKQWKIWFDEDACLVANDIVDPEYIAGLELSAVYNSPDLFYRKKNDNKFNEIKNFPQSLSISEYQDIDVVPLPIPESYFGMIYYPQYIQFQLNESTETIIGRSVNGSKQEKPDIDLSFLTHPKSLSWIKNQKNKGPLNMYRLSRLHLKFLVKESNLHITFHEQGKVAVYGLDKDLNLIKKLRPNAADEIKLSSGDHLLIGCYVLCYKSPE